jgi:hypothetical protein
MVATRTGTLSWGFSLKWGLVYVGFLAVSLAGFAAACALAFSESFRAKLAAALRAANRVLGIWRWPVLITASLLPACILQVSPWGVVFDGPFARVFLWTVGALTIAWAMPLAKGAGSAAPRICTGFVATGVGFLVAAAFSQTTDYPFSLGWSEGNRLWDYSLLFGKDLYIYAAGHPPVAYLDIGRQLIGGLPFLLPRVSILGERSWLALLAVLPYVLLGMALFRPGDHRPIGVALLCVAWTLLFLSQGPIHAPIILSAMLVALATQRKLWISAGLVAVAGYFAELSRFTWLLAPATWAFMLEALSFNGNHAPSTRQWLRGVVVGGAGLAGAGLAAAGFTAGGGEIGSAAAASSSQALLWYRLLPNATYGRGILIGILIAAGPAVASLAWLTVGRWRPGPLASAALILPPVAFLLVGLVVSTKIGGGGDLHNLDMFMITIVIIAALGWRTLGRQWTASFPRMSSWAQAGLVLALALPAFQPLMVLRPLSFGSDSAWLTTLTGAQRARDLGSLPPEDVVHASLRQLQGSVEAATVQGEVLLMDQRQLLTFGYLSGIPLVSEFEKKRMMDEALSGNSRYFEPFYRDLARRRFSLIISSPLRTPIRDTEYGFGEENNAWVKWIAKPILCFYQEQDTLDSVKVELLVPRTDSPDCVAVLP